MDCESLDLSKSIQDLVKMAQIDQLSNDTALKMFKCKFSDAKFQVRELDDILHNHKGVPVHILRENSIQISNYNFLLELLRLFGQSIKKIAIDFHHTPVGSCKRIMRSIRIHCESLTELDLFGSRGFELNEVDTPFQNVQNVSVNGKWKKWGSNNLNFGQIFPNLRRLDIKSQGFSIDNPQSIAQIYQNLEYLHVSLAQLGNDQDGLFLETIIEDLLKLNPTIQSLSLVYASERFLSSIAHALPYLESLKLTDIHEIENKPQNGQQIVMENVRNLEIVSQRTSKHILRQTTFSHLEELTLDLNPTKPDEINHWMDFIENQKELVFLKIYGFVKNDHLTRFTNNLPELTNIIVKCDRSITTESIIQFVKQTNQLIIFDLRGLIDVSKHSHNLIGQFDEEWKIELFEKERRLRISRKM